MKITKRIRAFKILTKRLISNQTITPHSIAMGIAIGIFIGLGPTIGFQIIPALFICTLLKYNKIAGMLAVWITNPLTIIPIYTFNISIGHIILSSNNADKSAHIQDFFSNPTWNDFIHLGRETITAFILGCLLVGLVSAIFSYFVAKYVIIFFRKKKNHRKTSKIRKTSYSSKSNPLSTKDELRRKFLAHRNQLSPEEVSNHCKNIMDYLDSFLKKKKFQYTTVMSFYPLKNEIDTLNWIQKNLNLNKRIFFPKVTGPGLLEAIEIKNLEQDLFLGYKDIKEPRRDSAPYLETIDLILVPGLAFSLDFHRIGYGKGFYDRFLLRQPKSLKIGLFYDFQLASFNPDQTDFPLDVIITPSQIYQ